MIKKFQRHVIVYLIDELSIARTAQARSAPVTGKRSKNITYKSILDEVVKAAEKRIRD